MTFVVRRVIQMVIVLFAVTVLVFFLARLSGDPVFLMLPADATPQEADDLRQAMGFDQPLLVQLGAFLAGLPRGDFGESIRYHRPAMELVLEAFPATVRLAALAFSLSIAVAVPMGMMAAFHRNTMIDMGARVAALLGQCFPTFWLGLLLILVFAFWLRVLPPSGGDGFRALVLPATALGLYQTALLSRLLRASLLEVLQEDFIKTARAKGVPEGKVILKHALRNAALPVTTILAINLGRLLAGAIVIEQVFAYPGMGRLAYLAIINRDFPVVQAFVFFVALIVTVIALIVDLVNSWLDPRIRYE